MWAWGVKTVAEKRETKSAPRAERGTSLFRVPIMEIRGLWVSITQVIAMTTVRREERVWYRDDFASPVEETRSS